MKYAKYLDRMLQPKRTTGSLVLDLFAGCGGLSLGFEAAGFKVIGYEQNNDACRTYSKNLVGECRQIRLDAGYKFPRAVVVIGGPPCQPFSVNGNQQGKADTRNGFEIFISAVRQSRPKIWMFENVRGMLGKNRRYFESVVSRLEKLGYTVEYRILNARSYGVPQNRERVIVIGHRGAAFSWPKNSPTEITAGEALGRLKHSAPKNARYVTAKMLRYIARYEKASCCVEPRDLRLDAPARTLTCRNLAGATGDMHRILLKDGRRRLLRPKEAARLQGFPSWIKFQGSETSQLIQIGNAVPPLVALKLARKIKAHLETIGAVHLAA